MKKNISKVKKNQPKSVHIEVGLFASQQSRQHILQDFKRGTLFQHSVKTQNRQEINRQTIQEDNRCWINDIALGKEEWMRQLKGQDSKIFKKADKAQMELPIIQGRIKKNKENSSTLHQCGCNKMICLQKKLNRQGAWNSENGNNIEQNVSKLEQSLYLHPKQLTRNDFYRVKGLNFKSRSLEDSIHCFGNSTYTIHNSTNPFENFPLYSSTFGDEQQHFCNQRILKKKRNKLPESTEHFIPTFLLKYLMISEETLPKY